jgi:hypothetical protein
MTFIELHLQGAATTERAGVAFGSAIDDLVENVLEHHEVLFLAQPYPSVPSPPGGVLKGIGS